MDFQQVTDVVRDRLHIPIPQNLSEGRLSKRPLGLRLPLRRTIPQDVHSVFDYMGGAMNLLCGTALCNSKRAGIAASVLAGSALGVSLLTDYRLSLAKLIPIEAHEVIDYVWGASNVVAPFALGYAKKDPAVSVIQCAIGLGTIVASLFTDYRAFSRGGRRSRKRSRVIKP